MLRVRENEFFNENGELKVHIELEKAAGKHCFLVQRRGKFVIHIIEGRSPGR